MAWEEFQRGPVLGVTGDEPFDEMGGAIERIQRAYRERFGRNPYFAELLYALQATVEADPPAYVADETLPTLKQLVEFSGINETTLRSWIRRGTIAGAFQLHAHSHWMFRREMLEPLWEELLSHHVNRDR